MIRNRLFTLWRTYVSQREISERLRALSANLELEVEARTAEVRRAYAALQQSEERYRLLAENTQDVIWTMAPDGGITYVSPAVEQVRGLSPQEAMRQPLEEVLTPDSQAISRAYFTQVHTAIQAGLTPEKFRGELEYWRRDGTTLWTDVAALPILAPDGALVEILGVTRDISARKAAEDMARANELRMRRMLDNIPTAIAAVSLAPEAQVLFVNEQFLHTFGYAREDIPTLNAWEHLAYPDEDYRAAAAAWWQQAVAQALGVKGRIESPQVHIACKDGRRREVVVSAIAMDDMLLISLLDITERRAAEESLRISEERHRLWADNSVDLIWTMGRDGVITYVSPSVERLLGYTPQEFMRLSIEQMFTAASYAIVAEGLAQTQAHVQAGRSVDFTARELEHVHKDGSLVWTEITATEMYDRNGRFLELLGITRDVSARKRNERELAQAHAAAAAANQALQAANAELRHLASTDVLTGLWNRRYFEQSVATAMTQAQRYAHPLSLVLFDIDHFKSVNDQHGHHTGDLVLIEMAARVRCSLREADILARWGGEEFVVMMPHCGQQDAVQLAEKVRALVAGEPFPVAGRITSSFGVAEFARGETLDTWLERVDDALYRAKEGGRNRVVAGEARSLTGAAGSLHLVWRERYVCGEPLIDREHRELFELANELLDLAVADATPQTLLSALNALLDHAVAHFAHEEEILCRWGYLELEHHRGLHRCLVERALQLRGQVENEGSDFGTLVDFLSRQLVVLHMLKADRAFFPLFAARQDLLK